MRISFLLFGTVLWLLGWMFDVGTTARGIHRARSVAGELNPIARRLIARLGLAGGFAFLAVLEGALVAAHWALAFAAPQGFWAVVTFASCAASLAFAGVAHALAGWGNRTGRIAAPLIPIAQAYRWLDRRWAPRKSL